MSSKTQVATSFMEENLHRAIRVGEIARLVRLSRSRLCYLFKAEVGLAPTQYLKKVRMEKALELLHTSFLSIKEVASKVGYNDSTHFMCEFKKAYGSTPISAQGCFCDLPIGQGPLRNMIGGIR